MLVYTEHIWNQQIKIFVLPFRPYKLCKWLFETVWVLRLKKVCFLYCFIVLVYHMLCGHCPRLFKCLCIAYVWKLFEIMQLFLVANVGVVTQARGSAYIEMGQTKVISAM